MIVAKRTRKKRTGEMLKPIEKGMVQLLSAVFIAVCAKALKSIKSEDIV